jgi:hypothetical protein
MLNYSSKIVINGDALSTDDRDRWVFDHSVARVLDRLRQFAVGRVIFDQIHLSSRSVWIYPSFEPGDDPNATAGVNRGGLNDDQFVAAVAGKTRKGAGVVSQNRKPFDPAHKDDITLWHGKPLKGTGKGADVRVSYTPRDWVGYVGTWTPETVLLHELTHAARALLGLQNDKGTHDWYVNEEEFYGVLLENLFRSEWQKKGRPDLRLRGWYKRPRGAPAPGVRNADAHFVPLPPNLATSAAFYAVPKHQVLILQLSKQMPGMARALKRLGLPPSPGVAPVCEFDPFTQVSLPSLGV